MSSNCCKEVFCSIVTNSAPSALTLMPSSLSENYSTVIYILLGEELVPSFQLSGRRSLTLLRERLAPSALLGWSCALSWAI